MFLRFLIVFETRKALFELKIGFLKKLFHINNEIFNF
jgi:hypothetical protein